MLLDAASLYFRAFYGVPTSVTTPDGRLINAVRGFLDMTARLVVAHRPPPRRPADHPRPGVPGHARATGGPPPPRPPGRLLGRRLAAGVPGRRPAQLQGAPGGRGGRRGGPRRARPAGPGAGGGAGGR